MTLQRPDQRKIIEDYRDMIENENRRVNERLTIFCQFQGLLVSALALGWEKSNNSQLMILVTALGFLSAVVQSRALFQATRAIDLLYEDYVRLSSEVRQLAGPIVGNIPHPDKALVPSKLRVFLTPSMVLPLLMVTAWLYIILFKIFHLF